MLIGNPIQPPSQVIDLCTFNHGLGIIFVFYPSLVLGEKIIEYKFPTQTSRNLLRSCQSFGLTDMKILSDRKIFCRSGKKKPQKITVMCIMFSLAFLECFTLVLAIGHLISPLVFIEVKVIQFLVFSVVQNCICYVFYSVCLEFCCFDEFVKLYYRSMVV